MKENSSYFDNLSESQIRVFEQIAINNDAGHNPRTLDSLLRKGLIETFQIHCVSVFYNNHRDR